MNIPNPLVPLSGYVEFPVDEMRKRARAFLKQAGDRRTVRDFSDRPIPRDIIETCILAAGTAPNGAHRQPWRFVAVSDPEIKRAIRVAAEEEEKLFYGGRAPEDWLEALVPLGTDETTRLYSFARGSGPMCRLLSGVHGARRPVR